jgi:hypothetical protein
MLAAWMMLRGSTPGEEEEAGGAEAPVAPSDLSVPALVLEVETSPRADVYALTPTITWSDNSDDETEFTLQHSIDGGAWTTIATAGEDAESFASGNAVYNTEYDPDTNVRFRIRSGKPVGPGFRVSSPSNVVEHDTGPGFPTGLTVASIEVPLGDFSGMRYRLQWTDGATSEPEFRVSADLGSGWVELGTIAAETTIFDTEVYPVGEKSFRVTAYNANGESGPSNVITVSA